MNLYFIRHTKVATPKGLCYGQLDIPLATSFKEEAMGINEKLQKIMIDVAYSSPLQRTLQLAHFCGYKKPMINTLLMELHFGEWEGKMWDEIYSAKTQYWFDDWISAKPPNGESFLELKNRLDLFLTQLASYPTNIIIFTHSGIIRAAYHIINKVPLHDLFDKLSIDYGSIHHFIYEN